MVPPPPCLLASLLVRLAVKADEGSRVAARPALAAVAVDEDSPFPASPGSVGWLANVGNVDCAEAGVGRYVRDVLLLGRTQRLRGGRR